jgi:phage terminase small subunit
VNDQQKAFGQNWVANGFNATKAAKDAGYSPDTAYSQGNRLLNHVEVRAYINELLKDRKDNTELDRARWVATLEAIAYGELDQVVNIDTGALKENAQIPDEVRVAIEKVESDGKGRRRITMASKTKALELLGRHRAYLKDDDKTGVTIVFQQGEADGLV